MKITDKLKESMGGMNKTTKATLAILGTFMALSALVYFVDGVEPKSDAVDVASIITPKDEKKLAEEAASYKAKTADLEKITADICAEDTMKDAKPCSTEDSERRKEKCAGKSDISQIAQCEYYRLKAAQLRLHDAGDARGEMAVIEMKSDHKDFQKMLEKQKKAADKGKERTTERTIKSVQGR